VPSLSVTEAAAEMIMTLPISARMTIDDVDYVVDHLALILAGKGGA
jgi:dTDP-4-amino-4,6-dideoxygalactose transaminase